MNAIASILQKIEDDIKTNEERSYFWIHEVRYAHILRQVESITSGKKLIVLDIGCFPYHIGEALERLGHTVYGIASYHEPIKRKNVAILNVETEKFPYKNDIFDLVLFNEIIEHLPQSPVLPLREIHRVTKSDGFLMATTPNIARSINRGKLILGKTIMYPVDVYFEEQGKGNNIYHRHNREYSLKELCAIMEHSSWNVIKKGYFISYAPFRKRTIPDPLWLLAGKWINYFLMTAFPPLRDTLFVLGKNENTNLSVIARSEE
jgi:2-polyprenyl-3-methyl-5-hydroxy-6-metoxy-1,4-benzoquinol methylase